MCRGWRLVGCWVGAAVAVVGFEVGVGEGMVGFLVVVGAEVGKAVVAAGDIAAVEEGGRAREGGEAYVAGGRHHGLEDCRVLLIYLLLFPSASFC